MTSFFYGQVVAMWSPSVPIYGDLVGDVYRSGNVVTLINMNINLRTQLQVSGTKSFIFLVNDIGTQININTSGTTNLGVYNLMPANLAVTTAQTSDRVSWSSSDSRYGQFNITFPAPPALLDLKIGEIGETYITLEYGASSFVSPTSGTVKLLGGTTNNPTTELASSATTGYQKFVYSGLTPNTTYYFKTTATNGQMDAESSVTSESTLRVTRFYGSVNGKAKRVYKLYVGVNGTARQAEFYGSQDGQAKRIL